MKVQEIPMSMKEFEMMQHPFGWKAEYYGGKAVFTPREYGVNTQLKITQREVKQTYPLRPVDVTFKEQMIDAFFATFQDSVEFCNWPLENIQKQATKNINNYFKGVRGEPLPFSIMAVEPNNNNHLIGLALLIKNRSEQIRLDLLFVTPNYQRKGVATQMVSCAINQLHTAGIQELHSSYHICNEMSKKWHHLMGFGDVYDQYYIRLKYSWYRHEIWRHQKLGLDDKIEPLIQQRDDWYHQLDDHWKY